MRRHYGYREVVMFSFGDEVEARAEVIETQNGHVLLRGLGPNPKPRWVESSELNGSIGYLKVNISVEGFETEAEYRQSLPGELELGADGLVRKTEHGSTGPVIVVKRIDDGWRDATLEDIGKECRVSDESTSGLEITRWQDGFRLIGRLPDGKWLTLLEPEEEDAVHYRWLRCQVKDDSIGTDGGQ